jgi:hypothetical protein
MSEGLDAVFEGVREFGMVNRPPGYAHCPKDWEKGQDRSDRFHYGTITYKRALPYSEIYAFELVPVYTTREQCVRTMLAMAAFMDETGEEETKASVREMFARWEVMAEERHRVVGNMASVAYREHRVPMMGQYTARELEPVMMAAVGYVP